jgi:hypothetical protein
MSTVVSAGETVRTHIDLHLDQTLLGAERVLALLRCRGYRLRSLMLEAPASCAIDLDVDPARRTLLLARLERIPGVRVEAVG